MIVIPPGSFTIGSSSTEFGHYDNEGPQHLVTIEKPFALGLYHVTRGQYRQFIEETGHKQQSGCDFANAEGTWTFNGRLNWKDVGFPQTEKDPVLCISWGDAQAYVSWLNRKITDASQSGPYRLMSEAEYEYGARAGTDTPYYWGKTATHDYANYGLDQCPPCGPAIVGRDRWLYTSPSGSFPPNAFGLYDMSGNAWTFVEDCAHDNFDGAPVDGSAWVSEGCGQRMVRGGGWEDKPKYIRIADRWASPENINSPQVGFRVARSLSQP